MTRVMCFGTFDCFHPGHLSYLKQASNFGDFLIIVLARDKNVLELKKKSPIYDEKKRGDMMKEELEKTDLNFEIILGNLEDKFLVIKEKKADIICLGYDQMVDMQKLEENFSGKIVRLKAYRPDIYKSSKILMR